MAKRILCLALLVMIVSGCETTLNETQTGALAGGGLGAGLGAIIGEQTGHAGAGTAIGAGAGALSGALIGEGIRRSRQQQATQVPQYQQTAPVYQQPANVQEIHTKYNPKTGKTFPESYQYDPEDGAELLYIQ